MIRQADRALRDRARAMAYADGKSGHLDLCALWQYYTKEMKREDEELSCRRMVVSCVCYGTEYDFYDERTKTWGRYGLTWAEKLGDERALEIFRDQRDYMREHATIHCGVHTDFEGCTYNSITWN